MIDCLGNPESFVPEGSALRERAQLGMAQGEPGTGARGGQVDWPKRSRRRAPSRDATVCLRQSIARR